MIARWERVTSLFAAARMLDAGARDAFLGAACAGDAGLRAEVEGLLAADVPDDGFLEDPPGTSLSAALGAALGEPSSEPQPAGLPAGRLLKGRYRVDRALATGGQAVVHLAHDEVLARSVVVKVMRAEGRRNRWLKARFEEEMQALARIDHPGVVGILDVGALDDGSPFLVIQHVPGVSLREALSGGPLPPERAAAILRQIGSALRAAHAAGVAHRDLKPANVMLQPRDGGAETVRLIDFGIAKVERSDSDPHTTSVMVVGTVRYMAPEQFEGKHSIASDVYTMALVACEMLGGHPHVRALPAGTPRAARAALEAALAFRPEERPPDVEAWSARLAGTLAAGRRRGRRIAAGVAVVAVAAAGVGGGRWMALASVPPVRVVEKVGGFDPLIEGFVPRNDVTGFVLDNAARTGYEGWRVATTRQGYYVQRLTWAQKRLALERGWRLTAEMRGDTGSAVAGVDFAGVGGRFDINVLRDGDEEVVRLLTQIVPHPQGVYLRQRPPGQYHRYELVYDPNLRSADLWVDGVRRLTGYRGHGQYLEDRGLQFGAALYKSERASGSFRSVRFEINP